MSKIHKTKSKSRSVRRKTRSRAKRGGMMRASGPHATATALTFRAMDAAAAATTNPHALEAIRLTKQIMHECTDVSFHAEGGIYYLDVSVDHSMAPSIWGLVNAMKEIPQMPMGAIVRNRDDMVRLLSACSHVPPPLQMKHQLPSSVSQKERKKLLGGPMKALMMHRLMTTGMDARSATKMTTCMTNYYASELARPPPIVRNALETIGMVAEGGPEVADNMMFRVEMDYAAKFASLPNGHSMNPHDFAEFYEAYTGMPPRADHDMKETMRVALQKLCDTLMPADVVVAVAKKIQNEELTRAIIMRHEEP